MTINPQATIEVTAFQWVPPMARGRVKDLRVRWALEEAGLDYRERLLSADRFPGYLLEQPFNQVPCLRDGAVQMFESGAIVQYIGEKSEALLPGDHQGRYRAIQWTYAALNSVEPFVQERALLESFYAGEEWAKLKKPTSEQLAQLRVQQVSDWLGSKQWLEGDHFTIGDLIMVTVLRTADGTTLLDDKPNLLDYRRRGEARAAFQQALADHLAPFAQHELEGVAA